MRTPKNFFLIAVKKEQKLGSGILYAPVLKGEQENELKPVSGIVVGLPDKYTKDHTIASNFKGSQMTALDLMESCMCIKEGDEVFLSYLAFDDDRIVITEEDQVIYRVPVHHLIAKKGENGLEAVAGKVLIRPVQEDSIISKVLVSPFKEKKHGHGEVISCCATVNKVAAGTKVAYMERLAEWIEIDGEKYDFVYLDEILGVI